MLKWTTLKLLLEFLIYSNIWVSAGIAALACFCMQVLGLTPDIAIISVCFFSALLVMNFDRFIDSRFEERPDMKEQKFYLSSSVDLMLIIALFGTVLSFLVMPKDVQIIGAACIGIGVIYGVPIIRIVTRFSLQEYGKHLFSTAETQRVQKEESTVSEQEESKDNNSQSYRLKDIKGIKAWLTAAVVTLAVVGVPLAYSRNIHLDWEVAQLVAFVYVFLVSNAHMFDVRDLDSDREKGLQTLPVLLGMFQAKVVIVILNTLMSLILVYNYYLGHNQFFVESILLICYTAFYVYYFNADKSRLLYALVVDGGLFLPLVFWVAHHKFTSLLLP